MTAQAKAIDDTLEVVRDVSKFKKRIEEMQKLQTQIDASGAKAKAKQQQLNVALGSRLTRTVASIRLPACRSLLPATLSY